MLLLGGIDLTQTRRRSWHPVSSSASKNNKTNIVKYVLLLTQI
jgi:hypothetical protein